GDHRGRPGTRPDQPPGGHHPGPAPAGHRIVCLPQGAPGRLRPGQGLAVRPHRTLFYWPDPPLPQPPLHQAVVPLSENPSPRGGLPGWPAEPETRRTTLAAHLRNGPHLDLVLPDDVLVLP